MKQTNSSEGVKAKVRTVSVKKIGASFGLVLTVAAVGAVAVYGFTKDGSRIKTDGDDLSVTTTSAVVTTAAPEDDEEVEISETITWWKAGVEDYDFAEVTSETAAAKKTTKATTTTTAKTTTKAAEQTTAAKAKTTTKTAAATKAATTKKVSVEKISDTTLYATAALNVRAGAGTTYDKLGTLSEGTAVTATGKADGWYQVKYGDKTGYVSAEYVSTKKPAATTTKAAVTTTKAKAQAPVATTTTAAAKKTSSVISYTDEEYEMLCYVLQGEVGNCSEASKIAVANVVINRVKDGRFGKSIKAVLTAPNQFTAIYGYYDGSKVPSQNTRDCALRALQGEDNSNGAVYYYAPKYCSGSVAAWFESLTFCLELDGQRYFK